MQHATLLEQLLYKKTHTFSLSFLRVTLSFSYVFFLSSFFLFRASPESRPVGAFLRQRLPELFWYQSFEAARGMLSEVDM